LAPLFYRDSDGAVLVFDLCKKESFDMVDVWFQELNGYAQGIKIILVGNKCDMPSNKIQVKNEDAKNLADKYGAIYLAASALEDRNINEMFSTLSIDIYHTKRKKEKEGRNRKKSIKLLTIPEGGNNKKGCC
jgi:GTPase SAR1 family protein